MRKTLSIAGLLFGISAATSGAATLLYSENFDGEGTNYNLGTNPEVNVGGIGVLQSSGTGQGGNAGNNAWSVATGGNGSGANGMRFGSSPGYNWATGANSALILADGGLRVSYSFDLAGGGIPDDWMIVRVGSGAENAGVGAADTAFGVITRGDGRMQTFDNGGGVNNSNEFGTATAPTLHNFTLEYAFTSWAAGSTVNFTGYVDGVKIGTDSFTWDASDDMRIFFGGRVVGSLIDNIQVSTIPEPSAALLSGLGALALLRRRRN